MATEPAGRGRSTETHGASALTDGSAPEDLSDSGLLILDSGRLMHLANLPTASGQLPAVRILSHHTTFAWAAPMDLPTDLAALAQSLWVIERRTVKAS